MKSAILLALDLGAESGRVMAAGWDGRRLGIEEIRRFPNAPVQRADTLRWDLPYLWRELEFGLVQAGTRYAGEIAGIGVDTWGLDYVLLSRTDEVLELPYCYRDARTRGRVDELCRRLSREEIFAASGCQFLEINTLCQWLAHQEQHPEAFVAADRFLLMPDWVNWCLTGGRFSEFTNATTTQFLNPKTRQWSTELLKNLNLPTHLLPELVLPGTKLGNLRPGVADRTGLDDIPVIAPGTHDTASAVAAIPTDRTGKLNWAYISSGTWSLVGIESPDPLLSQAALACNVTNEGGVEGTWRVLKNVMGLWLVQRCRQSFCDRGATIDYASLVELAANTPGLRSLVDPDDPLFFNPADMAIALQSYCQRTGQPIPMDEGALVRCALESLALKYALIMDQLESLTRRPIEIVHIVGGGSRNQLLNQLTANATSRSVVAGPVEATTLGNALMQLRALGELDSLREIRKVARDSSELRRFEPEPDPSGCWTAARARFQKLVAPQKPIRL